MDFINNARYIIDDGTIRILVRYREASGKFYPIEGLLSDFVVTGVIPKSFIDKNADKLTVTRFRDPQ